MAGALVRVDGLTNRQQGARLPDLLHERDPIILHGLGVESEVILARLPAEIAMNKALRLPWRMYTPFLRTNRRNSMNDLMLKYTVCGF